MLPTVYGFADDKEVDKLMRARIQSVKEGEAVALADMLGQAVFALMEINDAIPVQAKHRHLVAAALENFAEGNGPT